LSSFNVGSLGGRRFVAITTAPSVDPSARASIGIAPVAPATATALGTPLPGSGPVHLGVGLDRSRLARAGFTGAIGSTIVLPTADGAVQIGYGIGDPGSLDAAGLRNAVAAYARATSGHERLAIALPNAGRMDPATAAQAVVEGVLLTRYRFDAFRSVSKGTPVRELTLVTDTDAAEAEQGARRGQAFAHATMFARDMANTPHSHLSASRMGEIAQALGPERGFEVEVFDKDALVKLGIGGILGVNAGSAEPPRMIRLSYRPASPTGRLALVGKGIMYDSGGIALKPADAVHAQMKNDMSGAAAILATVSELAEVGCTTEVTGYLMCTDSMPSGTAMALGDVITIRGGTTVEVVNTDAEGRLVMADGLVLAREAANDAIVDIATLTGASMRALGTEIAALFGNHQGLVDQVRLAAGATDEPVWQLPLHRGYRPQLDSTIADLKNLGHGEGGAITAALFLAEFVGDTPWAHIDMAGTATYPADWTWHPAGCSGFGARLLLQLALDFSRPTAA
jgi:leucyl aminopeptidase